ncbi:hypothetical protein OH492_05030 [Vibrio chagasii]|nr:hypothetical protein [Vibrio chagasii]
MPTAANAVIGMLNSHKIARKTAPLLATTATRVGWTKQATCTAITSTWRKWPDILGKEAEAKEFRRVC